jgi:hypothetical protein
MKPTNQISATCPLPVSPEKSARHAPRAANSRRLGTFSNERTPRWTTGHALLFLYAALLSCI